MKKDKESGSARIYPCQDCGQMRSAEEGGATFTVCDECWEKHYAKTRTVKTEDGK